MKAIWAIVFKDVVVELRNKETLSAMLMFAVLILIVFNFAFESSGVDKSLIAPGTLWVAFSFAAILGLNRSLARELDNECRACFWRQSAGEIFIWQRSPAISFLCSLPSFSCSRFSSSSTI
jgi:hypothetical protein